MNVNEAKIDFEYDDKDPTYLVVTLEVWKHLDGSFIEDIIVEPTYLRVTIKGKILQLRFLEEVYCSEERYICLFAPNYTKRYNSNLSFINLNSLAKVFFFIIYSVTVERNRASGHLVIKMKKFKQDLNDYSNPKKESQNIENVNDSSNGEY